MISTSIIPNNVSNSAGALGDESNFDISTLGKDDFLTLLIAQMKHQDPLNPASNTEFVAQLAQFSSLEQMTTMNTNLEASLNLNTGIAESVSNAMIINYFGKSVTAEIELFGYDGTGSQEITFELEHPAAYGTIQISDESGNILDTVSMDVSDFGTEYTYEWDGMTTLGVRAPEGVYEFKVEAFDALDNEIGVTPLSTGIVDGISYADGETKLNIGGISVPFNKVRSITEAE